MLVVCGGYEGVLVGLETDLEKCSKSLELKGVNESKESSNDHGRLSCSVTQCFKILCSQGSIKCMSMCGSVLVCGGSDETVQVYNLEKRKKHGDIMLPEGFITALEVFGGVNKGFILIGNEHGDISEFSVKDLSFSKSFKGHKKEITALAIHPEGNSFISTGSDEYLRLWDLNSKTCVFNTKLNFLPITAKWSNGMRYLLGSENEVIGHLGTIIQVLLCSTEDDTFQTIHTEDGDKVSSCCWLEDKVVLGFKSGKVAVYQEGSVTKSKVHKKRVKSVCTNQDYIFSADSDGTVLCMRLEDNNLELVWKYEVGLRVNVLVS